MEIAELEKAIAEMRSHPLLLVCRDRKGRQKVMTPEECRRTGSVFFHISLDALLAAELGSAQN